MPPVTDIITHLGLEPLRQATQDWFVRVSKDPKEHAAMLTLLRHLAARDLRLLDTIVSSTMLRALEWEWVESLLVEAHAMADPRTRKFIRRLAAQVGMGDTLKSVHRPAEILTASQSRVFEHMRALATLYFDGHGNRHPSISLRLNPLIVGPSGSGKTHLVNRLGQTLRLPVLRLTVGDWVVLGAKQQPPTIEHIQAQLEHHEKLIIFIDELDKFRSLESSWSLAQITEILALLDRRVGYVGSGRSAWLPKHDAALRDNVFIVGGGAWHDLWSVRLSRKLGFGATANVSDGICERIRQAQLIPSELINRFLDEWLVIEPYTAADFVAIGRHLGLGSDVLDPAAAEASGRNFRYVESAVTTAALKAQLQRQASESPPVSTYRSMP